MKIAVIGAKGNMGRRYCKILRYLRHEPVEIDIGDHNVCLKTCEGIIIATPTELHLKVLEQYCSLKKPILCEKPLSTNLRSVEIALEVSRMPIRMINQYAYFLRDTRPFVPVTKYDYFKTGNDGLYWDCINIIGLSKGIVEIENSSPIWHCELNGRLLNIALMDHAYVWNVGDWLGKFDDNKEYILEAHKKTQEFIDAQNIYWDSGKTSKHKT